MSLLSPRQPEGKAAPCRRHSTSRAFTLVELLIAILLGLLVATSATLALHSTLATWTRLSTTHREHQTALELLARLERDIASLQTQPDSPCVGSANSLHALLLQPDPADPALPSHPRQVTWSYDPATATVTRTLRPAFDHSTTSRESFTIFAPVPGFQLAYLPAEAPVPELENAQSDWDDPDARLPLAIRVRIADIAERVMICELAPAQVPQDEPLPWETTLQ